MCSELTTITPAQYRIQYNWTLYRLSTIGVPTFCKVGEGAGRVVEGCEWVESANLPLPITFFIFVRGNGSFWSILCIVYDLTKPNYCDNTAKNNRKRAYTMCPVLTFL